MKTLSRVRWAWALVFVAPLLIAAINQGTMEAIAFVISVLIGLLGPRPMRWLLDKLNLEGQGAVIAVYVAAFVVGLFGLALSKELFELAWTWDNALAIAGVMFAAATYAYHRLKDNGDI